VPRRTISINRAPVLTLWAAVVARRLRFTKDKALTLGKAVAGLNAQAKGRGLGIFKPHEETAKQARAKKPSGSRSADGPCPPRTRGAGFGRPGAVSRWTPTRSSATSARSSGTT
jgi:hypothetical protein